MNSNVLSSSVGAVVAVALQVVEGHEAAHPRELMRRAGNDAKLASKNYEWISPVSPLLSFYFVTCGNYLYSSSDSLSTFVNILKSINMY